MYKNLLSHIDITFNKGENPIGTLLSSSFGGGYSLKVTENVLFDYLIHYKKEFDIKIEWSDNNG